MSARLRLTCLLVQVCSAMSLGAACGDDGGSTDTDPTTAPTTDDPTGAGTDDPTGAGTDDPTTGTTGAAEDPWMTPYCYTVADKKWLAPWIEREDEVVALVNAERAAGADCRSAGKFAPAEPLAVEPRVHCAARKHSQDMGERDFFDHVNPDGEGLQARLQHAGYPAELFGENIAAGTIDPAFTVEEWLEDDEFCAILMTPDYVHVGIGFYEGPGSLTYYWTLDMTKPLPE
ncbi:CAP domain-containing protein [Nannocystis sp. SCPEA4]|uniref:CAP domain-containing protein n=1 Tax=Nannocystis sp. SCPEA4 TaxID=2996787 RepID=UPI0022718944|nr:CAP domain-containing protein [Nannocystis sp. SCPEA4]MCY1053837.1 CAP domain-containing protein [Nannocystis sp. SCPEA4]